MSAWRMGVEAAEGSTRSTPASSPDVVLHVADEGADPRPIQGNDVVTWLKESGVQELTRSEPEASRQPNHGVVVIPATLYEEERATSAVAQKVKDSTAGGRPLRRRIVAVDSTQQTSAGTQPSTSDPLGVIRQATDKITKWIPTEILSIYVPAVALLSPAGPQGVVGVLAGFALFTPMVVLAAAYSRGPITNKSIAAAILGVFAFLLWSLIIPGSAWEHIPWVYSNETIVTIVAALTGIVFSYVAEGVVSRIHDPQRQPK